MLPRDARLSELRAVAPVEGAKGGAEKQVAELRATTPWPGIASDAARGSGCDCAEGAGGAAEDRYGSVEEMRVDLERHLEGLPIGARATGKVERGWLWVVAA